MAPLGLSIDFDSTRRHNYLIDEKRLDGFYYILLDENDQMIRQGGLLDVIAGLKE